MQTTKGILSPDRETALRIKVSRVIPRKAQIRPSVQPPWLSVHNSMHQAAHCPPSRIPHGAMYFCRTWTCGSCTPWPDSSPTKLNARGLIKGKVEQDTQPHCVRWPGGTPLQSSPMWGGWSRMCLQDILPSALWEREQRWCVRGKQWLLL